ncbi:MAG TPA: benzoate-CoA ligase family protein [Kofleriaceae bacterium]|nr:benzoate-CoA ligase family protein [Kofleriaceae bacterium]
MGWSEVDEGAPPRVVFPRAYNAAADLIDRAIERGWGARTAYLDDRGAYTYADLAARVERAAAAFAALGVQPEQRVLLAMLDTIDFPAAFLGAIRMGAVAVPVNTLLTAHDYAGMIADSRARVIVASDPLREKLPGSLPVATIHQQATAAPIFASTPDDAAFWLYSSGSTGAPKGAVHLHAHLMWTAILYGREILGVKPDDVIYSAAKLFFAYGLGNALTFTLSAGASAVLTAERPTPAVVARIMKTHEPTIFCGVPTLFAALLADPSFQVSPKLRVSISAGEALPAHVGRAWRERFGTDILDGIGSTEMLHIFLSNRHGDVKYGTSGKPVPGYELALRGSGDELWVRGPSACTSYWNQRERSLATFEGGWTRTGDRYSIDDDGYYVYGGRADDMLKVGGIWVSPFEVESALAAHAAVLECAVVGHADADQLIKPKAFVVLKPGAHVSAEELKSFVKERLAPYKYPRWIDFVGELPKTATGKIQRFKLRAS